MTDQTSLFARPPAAVIESRVVAAADCEHCRRARAGVWGSYYTGCTSCRARLLARSLAASEALDPARGGDARELRAATARVLDMIPYGEARELVLGWWKSDHDKGSE